MRRGSKHITKKVFIPDESEEEKYKKVQAKKIQLRAEFEKHKKEILVNTTDISKSSEIRLKNQLEELMNANERRTQELERLEKAEERLENTNMEATYLYEAISKLDGSRESDAYLSVGFHPNRTTTTMFGVRHSNFLDSLGDKKAQLLETLGNIELLLEQEDEASSVTHERYQEMKKDQMLLSKKIHELEKMNDHASKRFTDLERIEFLAMNRHAASASNLKTVKDDLREIKNQELAYKKQKETDKKREIEFLNAKQNEVSNVLVELDKKRKEDIETQEELRRLELQHEEMRVKRKNTRIVTQYIELFHALNGENKLNLGAINQALKDISDQMDSSRSSSNKPPSVPEKRSSRNNSRDNSPSRRSNRPASGEEPALSPIKLNSAV